MIFPLPTHQITFGCTDPATATLPASAAAIDISVQVLQGKGEYAMSDLDQVGKSNELQKSRKMYLGQHIF